MIFLNVIKISPLRRKAEAEEPGYCGDFESCSQVLTHEYLGQGRWRNQGWLWLGGSSLISRSKRGGSQRGWESFESPSRAGRKGSQPAQPTCQTSALTKNLEVPCPQICPFWDGPQFELPVAVRFHLRGPPMEEGGVQGRLHLLLHFCGEVEEKELD